MLYKPRPGDAALHLHGPELPDFRHFLITETEIHRADHAVRLRG